MKPIEGKVANILNKRVLAMNIGKKDGVQEKMKFKVINEIPIVDPDTEEELGRTDREKIRVKVFQVKDRFSLARTYETYEVNVGGELEVGLSKSPLDKIFTPKKIEKRVKTFYHAPEFEETEDDSIPVKVGDQVVQIIGEENEEDTE